VGRLIERVTVEPDAALDARGHTAVDVLLLTDDGHTHARSLDIAPGFPDHPLSDAQQRARFDDCMAYAPRPPAQVGRFLDAVAHLGELHDARLLARLLVA